MITLFLFLYQLTKSLLYSELSNYIHNFMNSFIGSFMGSSVEYFVGYIHCKIRKNPAFSIKTNSKKSNKKPRFQAVIGLIPRFFNSCGRWDLNPHVLSDTRSLVLPVCHSSTPAQQRKFYHNFLYCASFFLVETKSFLRKRKVCICFIPANKCFAFSFSTNQTTCQSPLFLPFSFFLSDRTFPHLLILFSLYQP